MPIPKIRGTHNEQETRLMQPPHRGCRKDTITAMDDSILPWSTPRYLTRIIQKSSALSSLERCQGWVPHESLKKFLLQVNLYNWIEKQNKIIFDKCLVLLIVFSLDFAWVSCGSPSSIRISHLLQDILIFVVIPVNAMYPPLNPLALNSTFSIFSFFSSTKSSPHFF